MTYRFWILAAGVLAALAISLHSVKNRTRPASLSSSRPPLPRGLQLAGRWAYLLMLAGLAATALTGLAWAGLRAIPLLGYPLMLHVGAGGLFAVSLAALAIVWSDRNRFNNTQGGFSPGQHLSFWLMLVFGLLMILTGVGPMFPLFGTDSLRAILQLHRFSALGLAFCAAFHIYLTVRYRTL